MSAGKCGVDLPQALTLPPKPKLCSIPWRHVNPNTLLFMLQKEPTLVSGPSSWASGPDGDRRWHSALIRIVLSQCL